MAKIISLEDWLAEQDIKPADFAAELDVDHTTIWRIIKGKSKPSLDLAVAIERRTKGRIPVEVWAA